MQIPAPSFILSGVREKNKEFLIFEILLNVLRNGSSFPICKIRFFNNLEELATKHTSKVQERIVKQVH